MKLSQSVLGLLTGRRPGGAQPLDKGRMMGQVIARRYFLAAGMLFALQGIVALLGAADLVIPDFPSPVPFEFGRSVHLGLATLWPFIGSLGLVYYFVVEELDHDIFSVRLANWQFWLVLFSGLGIYGSLALRIGNGREYLEGMPVFYAGIAFSLALGAFNLYKTVASDRSRVTPAASVMAIGVFLLLVMVVPNIFHFNNPVADEGVKFWVVHLWEEMALELTTAGFVASFFKTTGMARPKDVEKWLYLEVSLTVVSALFGTGHHYFWIGYPAYWLVIGFAFSALQLVPAVFLVHMTYKGLKRRVSTGKREKLALWLILSSLLYHVLGAYSMGFIISVPWVNLYMHGTFLTSSHAHLAVFGALGFLVLGGSYYCLSRGIEPDRKSFRMGVLAVLALNLGLLVMAGSLLAGGLVQTYLWRVLGMDFMRVMALVQPYLALRLLGGGLFTLGDMLLGWQIFKVWKETRPRSAAPLPAD